MYDSYDEEIGKVITGDVSQMINTISGEPKVKVKANAFREAKKKQPKEPTFNPGDIIALNIDHKNLKLIKSQTRRPSEDGSKKFKNSDEELMYLMQNFDLNHLNKEQLSIMANFSDIYDEIQTQLTLEKVEKENQKRLKE